MKLPALIPLRSAAAWSLWCAIVLCAGCATAASDDTGRAIVDGTDFSMRPGDRVTLPDHSELRYVDVITDSRCPPEVQCVWAGDAEVAFTRTVDGATAQSFSLHTGRGARSEDFGGRRLTLVSLARGTGPQAELRLDPAP